MRILCSLIAAVMLLATLASAQTPPEIYMQDVASFFVFGSERPKELITSGCTINELPLVFAIAGESELRDVEVRTMRANGLSWASALQQAKLDPGILYFESKAAEKSRKFGPIWAKFKEKDKEEWVFLKFSDGELVLLSNIYFLNGYYDYPIEKIIGMFESGDGIIEINSHLHKLRDKTAVDTIAPAKTTIDSVVSGSSDDDPGEG